MSAGVLRRGLTEMRPAKRQLEGNGNGRTHHKIFGTGAVSQNHGDAQAGYHEAERR
jgi:hypothetical protein